MIVQGLAAVMIAIVGEWYAGGTLHKADGYRWVRATEKNRTATAADFASAMLNDSIVDRMKSVDELKPYAFAIRDCMDEAYKAPGSKGLKTAEVAATCGTLLRF